MTHSGATANTVTVYGVNGRNRVPVYLTTVMVGENPFGLTIIP